MEDNNNIPDKEFQDDEEEKKKKNKKVLIVVIVAIAVTILLIIILLLLLRFCKIVEPEPITTAEVTETAGKVAETTASGTTTTTASSGTTASSTETTDEATTTIEEETSSEEETTAEEIIISPTISIAIYEGPKYSGADNVCYYRIEATVTGTAPINIFWSKNDSSSLPQDKTQVNLHNPDETYNLVATATNAAGNDTDSILLSWGCNRPPVITDITLMGDHFTGIEYTVSAAASDPDGDVLSYSWSVTGGSIANPNINPILWTTPPSPATVSITVTVNDGKGGTASLTEPVEVTNMNRPPVLGSIIVRETESGYPAGNIYTGYNYDLFISATDPDGDVLTYFWEVAGGSLVNPNINPSRWTAPYSAGFYNIKVTVSDGRGGTVQANTTVQVKYYVY